MSKFLFGAVAAAAAIVCASPAAAATAFSGLTIEDVNVGGVLYDVTFKDGAMETVFPGRVYDFANVDDALAALDALIARSEFTSLVTPDFLGAVVPWLDKGADGFEAAIGGGVVLRGGNYGGVYGFDYTNVPGGAYAIATFEAQAVGVPEPATWALMLLGFGGAGVALRRRTAAAAA